MTMRLPSMPTSLHWLGDREDADKTRHAMDMRGCVLYFDRQSDCLQFMRWLENWATVEQKPCPWCSVVHDGGGGRMISGGQSDYGQSVDGEVK